MAENFFGITNTGRIRDNNEDTFLADTLPNGWIVACVIDGVGGYEGGEVAAEIARETLYQKLQQIGANPLQTLKQGILQANTAIYNEKLQAQGKDQMACVLTVALVDVENNQFYYAHVGDTRLYLLRDQSLVKVTKDHSFVGFLEDSGRLTEQEAMAHPKRNEINKALGFDPQLDIKEDYIETGSSPFLPGDVLMLCSDGLTDLVNNREMTGILLAGSSLAEKAQALVDAANVAGGKDNITVVIVRNHKKPLKIKATKPVQSKKNENNEEVAPVARHKEETPAHRSPVKKGGRSTLVPILATLCLLLAAACVWLLLREENGSGDEQTNAETTAYTPNAAEKHLADSLGLAANTINLTGALYGQSIVVGDTLFVRQDTLRINGNGIILQSDSAYAGPAFFATTNNKVLLLENIVFKDFATAVVLQGRGLQLRNVQFLNCAVPVQRQVFLPAERSLTGTLRDTIILRNDSLPK
ncbi:MAG TPA: protein phosphatase 2C domain-containing protein [Flavisolibacter sp.]|jgi:serine/threonine protein phosphatase PrpC|nr:protein phosphatase 2C domain-containing protein [Flavisolibacter sp.]